MTSKKDNVTKDLCGLADTFVHWEKGSKDRKWRGEKGYSKVSPLGSLQGQVDTLCEVEKCSVALFSPLPPKLPPFYPSPRLFYPSLTILTLTVTALLSFASPFTLDQGFNQSLLLLLVQVPKGEGKECKGGKGMAFWVPPPKPWERGSCCNAWKRFRRGHWVELCRVKAVRWTRRGWGWNTSSITACRKEPDHRSIDESGRVKEKTVDIFFFAPNQSSDFIFFHFDHALNAINSLGNGVNRWIHCSLWATKKVTEWSSIWVFLPLGSSSTLSRSQTPKLQASLNLAAIIMRMDPYSSSFCSLQGLLTKRSISCRDPSLAHELNLFLCL